jgi:hypothetical protein
MTRVRIVRMRPEVCSSVKVRRILILGYEALGLEFLNRNPGELWEEEHVPVAVAHLESKAT